jgi:MFS transporter, DHA2 family, multidrug resistance protein
MAYGGGVPRGLEDWEEEYGRRISAAVASLSQGRRMTILMSAGLVTAIEISNRLSINVLLPDMQGNVAASSDAISWVIILYNLGFLCSMALSFWMSRVIGTRRHLLGSLLLYSLGATGCFLSSHSLRLLLVSRIVMGFGGGAFLVRTVILSRLMFAGKARAVAITWLYVLLSVFEVIYPGAMGWIDDASHWNYAFLIDFPFLIVAAFMIAKFVPPGYLLVREDRSQRDVSGAFFLILSLSSLQIAMSRGERDEWLQSPLIAGALLIALISFAIFLWWDSHRENRSPVLHLRVIWRERALRTSLTVVMIVGAILGAGLFVIPQYLRNVQNYSATQTGGFISMYTLGLGIGLVISLRFLLPSIGATSMTMLGMAMVIATCTTFLFVWTPTTPTSVLVPAIFLQGFSVAPILLGASNMATGQAALADLNDVSTSYFFVRQLGNTFGVTAATVMFDRRMTLHSSRLLDIANRLDPILQSTLSQYAGVIYQRAGAGSMPSLGALQLFQGNVITQSELLSYIDIYFMLAILGCAGLLVLIFARVRSKSAALHFHLW